MSERKVKRVRRALRMQRKELLELQEQSARVGVRVGWRWEIFRRCLPVLRWVLPGTWLAALGTRAVAHSRWRMDGGDWRPYDPPRYFTAEEFR